MVTGWKETKSEFDTSKGGQGDDSQKRKIVPIETKRSVDQNVSSAGEVVVELGGPRSLGAEEATTDEMT